MIEILQMLVPCRRRLQKRIQEKQLDLQECRSDFPEGKSILDVATEDDVFRCYGTLLALMKFLDKLMLMANTLVEDKWLQRRASKPWYAKSIAYIW